MRPSVRKFFVIFIIVLVFSVLIVSVCFWVNRKKIISGAQSPIATPLINPVEQAKKNALSNPVETNSRGGALIVNRPTYQIVYQKDFDRFLISVTGSPFEEVRQEAEQEFLSIAKTNKSVACQLNVVVGTPYFANPGLAGQEFPLSFCE